MSCHEASGGDTSRGWHSQDTLPSLPRYLGPETSLGQNTTPALLEPLDPTELGGFSPLA